VPASAAELVALLDLETIDVNLFRGRQPTTSLQRVFGGQVAAQAFVAAVRTAPAGTRVHSLHSYFLRPGDTQVPIVYDVDPVREGRTFATRRVLARQHGRAIYAMTASFQHPEEGFEHQDAMPVVTRPEDSPTLASILAAPGAHGPDGGPSAGWLQEWAALDVRHAGDSGPGGALAAEEHPARARSWVRVAGALPDDRLLHEAVLTYLSDLTLLGAALVPYSLHPGSVGVQAASLDHSIWFHRPFRADEWLLYDQVSPSASGGRGLSIGRLFTAAGHLVATVAQEGLIRPLPSQAG